MSRYRVVHVISSLQVGGAEMLLLALTGGLQQHGFDNEVISLGAESPLAAKFEQQGIRVHVLGMARGRLPSVSQVVALGKACRTLKPDLIQGWMAHGNLAGVLMRAVLPNRVPLLWSVHQTLGQHNTRPLITRLSIRVLSLLSGIPTGIIYVSRSSREEHESFGFCSKQAFHVPNGVNTNIFFGNRERRTAARALLGLPDAAPVIGHVARYHPMKDQRTLLSAVKIVFAEKNDAHAVLIGRQLTPDNPELQSWACDPELMGRLHLLGPRSDVAALLPGFDVFCLSSAYGEACPVAMLEAMSCGVRCVVTDVADAAWMLADTGRLVPVRNPAALATELKRVLEMSPEVAAAASKRARDRVLELFNLDGMIERYRAIYLAAIEGKKLPRG